MRSLVFATFSLVVSLCGAAHAQTHSEEQLALAREVVELSDARTAMRDMLDMMAPQMADQIVASGASREYANRFVELFLQEFEAEAPRLLELVSIAYAGELTAEQLRDVRDFYASPSGRALIGSMSAINTAMSRAGMIMGEEMGQRALARMEAERGRRPENP